MKVHFYIYYENTGTENNSSVELTWRNSLITLLLGLDQKAS